MQNSMNDMNMTSNLTYKISMESLLLAVHQNIFQMAINEKYYDSTKLSIEKLNNTLNTRFILLNEFIIFPCI